MTGHLYQWVIIAPEGEEAFSDAALLTSMLRFEVALAQCQAKLSLIPQQAAASIAQHAGTFSIDPATLARAGAEAGSLAIPFVRALTAHVADRNEAAARYVHFGTTSQDVLDTALALCAKPAASALDQLLVSASHAAADLARRHAATPVLARTLLQPAGITTIGFKSAQWVQGLARTRRRLAESAAQSLAVSLGGAIGNLAAYGEAGVALRADLARALELSDPGTTWHTVRDRWIALACDLALSAGVMAKIARDISLMTQAEVAEAVEPQAEGRGGSTAMPHKRNPVLSMRVLAAVQPLPGLVANLLAAMGQEHERALGNWQAEMSQYPAVFIHALAAARALAELLEGLQIDEARCRANIDALRGTIFSEKLAALLLPMLGKTESQALVAQLCREALEGRKHLRDCAAEHPRLQSVPAADLTAVFDVEAAARVSMRQVEPMLEAIEDACR